MHTTSKAIHVLPLWLVMEGLRNLERARNFFGMNNMQPIRNSSQRRFLTFLDCKITNGQLCSLYERRVKYSG